MAIENRRWCWDHCSRQGGRRRNSLIRFLALCPLLLILSDAQAHDIRSDANPANDWIEGLANGENDICCGTNDCYPLEPDALQFSREGSFMVEIDDEWFVVPAQHLLRDSSPDGRAWACPERKSTVSGFIYRVHGIRCLLLPMMM